MAKQTQEVNLPSLREGIQVEHISLNFSVQCSDTRGEDPKTISINYSASMDFRNEGEVNKTVTEKPYLLELIPVIIKMLSETYDPDGANAKKLMQALGKAK